MTLDVPGYRKDQLTIDVIGRVLTVEGNLEEKVEEREEETPDTPVDKPRYHHRERHTASFKRQVTLPYEVDATDITARLENGVLHVEIPKVERDESSRKVAIT